MIKAIDLLEMSPVIAAIKDDAGLKRCLDTECQVVFILYGNICNIKDIVAELKAHGKCAMVHADLVQGLGSKEVAIDFIKESVRVRCLNRWLWACGPPPRLVSSRAMSAWSPDQARSAC